MPRSLTFTWASLRQSRTCTRSGTFPTRCLYREQHPSPGSDHGKTCHAKPAVVKGGCAPQAVSPLITQNHRASPANQVRWEGRTGPGDNSMGKLATVRLHL